MFDDKVKTLGLVQGLPMSEKDYDSLKLFIEVSFSKVGEVVFMPNGYKTLALNFNVGEEYCCFSIYAGCLFIRRIEIPSDQRGNGFLKRFLPSLELLLPQVGLKSICFENVQNEDLADFLISERGYSKAYFNFPRPENEDDFSQPEVYKILK